MKAARFCWFIHGGHEHYSTIMRNQTQAKSLFWSISMKAASDGCGLWTRWHAHPPAWTFKANELITQMTTKSRLFQMKLLVRLEVLKLQKDYNLRSIRPLVSLSKTLISIRLVPCFKFPFVPEGVTYSVERTSGERHIWISLRGWKASIRLFSSSSGRLGNAGWGGRERFVSRSHLVHVVLVYAAWVWVRCSEIETSWRVIVINL